MSHLTQLFVFPPSTSAAEQLDLLFGDVKKTPAQLSATARAVYGTSDIKIVNLAEDGSAFDALKIEQVRDLQLEVSFAPIAHELRVILIGNLELASLPAQHALLKLLEEPPEYVQMIITSAEPSALLPTILSRCQVVRVDGHSEAPPQKLPAELVAALDALPAKRLSVKTVFLISEKYKERPDALELMSTLTQHILSSAAYPTSELVTLVKANLQATTQLKQNVNPRLAIEDVLFYLVEKKL